MKKCDKLSEKQRDKTEEEGKMVDQGGQKEKKILV